MCLREGDEIVIPSSIKLADKVTDCSLNRISVSEYHSCHVAEGAATLSIMTFCLMTLGINGLYVTIRIKDTEHNQQSE